MLCELMVLLVFKLPDVLLISALEDQACTAACAVPAEPASEAGMRVGKHDAGVVG